MKKILLISITLITLMAFAYYLVTPNKIESYKFYSKAKIIEEHPTHYNIAEGNSYIISITKGSGASRTTTAHGYWDII